MLFESRFDQEIMTKLVRAVNRVADELEKSNELKEQELSEYPKDAVSPHPAVVADKIVDEWEK